MEEEGGERMKQTKEIEESDAEPSDMEGTIWNRIITTILDNIER